MADTAPVHAGTREDPYAYSDGSPIAYLDGEDQPAYYARVLAMSAPPVEPVPVVPVVPVAPAPPPAPAPAVPPPPPVPVATTGAPALAVPPVDAGEPSVVPAAPTAGASDTVMATTEGATVVPENYADFVAAQAAWGASVKAAVEAGIDTAAIAVANEQALVNAMTDDDRLRRVENALGLRSPQR